MTYRNKFEKKAAVDRYLAGFAEIVGRPSLGGFTKQAVNVAVFGDLYPLLMRAKPVVAKVDPMSQLMAQRRLAASLVKRRQPSMWERVRDYIDTAWRTE